MASVPCPHCRKPIPQGSRVCYHCLKDVVGGATQTVQRPTRRGPRFALPPRGERFVWLLRIVYAMYGYALATRTIAYIAARSRRHYTVSEWTGRLIMPAITVALVVTAMARVRKDPFMWTVVLAGLHTAQLFQEIQDQTVGWGSWLVAGALWVMAFAAPALARRLEGREQHKFKMDDHRVVGQVLVVFLGILAVLWLNRFMFDEVGDLMGISRPVMFYGGITLVGLAALWLDVPHAAQETLRFKLSLSALLLTVAVLALNVLHVRWWMGLYDERWFPEMPTWVGISWAAFALHALAPAVFEELLCRGVMWQAVRQRTSRWGTIVVTAVLFSVLHIWANSSSGAIPRQFVGGLMLGWLRAKTGSVTPCILVHAGFNALLYALS